MKRIWKTLGVSFLAAGVADAERSPNVLIIISDDQGIGDVGFMGNTTVKTPHLDRLAAESALFSHFIVAPACSPTRASFMTGRNHMSTGVWGVGDRNNLARDEILMPAFFKSNGYRTGYFGKRDGTYSVELEIWHRGADEATHVTGYQHKDPRVFTHDGVVQREGWTCDLDVEYALDFIERQGDSPWWCTVAFLLPHLPWVCDERFSQPYREAGCSDLLSDFYGCVTQMDDAIGRLLRGLEKLGRAEDTIVMFFSDNGPSYRGMNDEEIENRNPLGLRGQKAWAWENAIRVPLTVRWPKRIPAGERTQFATVEDLLPTLIDLVGLDTARFPPHHPFDGISLRPALENPDAAEVERAVLRLAISGTGQAGGGRWAVNDPRDVTIEEQHVVLRGPRFKLHNFADGTTALYELLDDPGETTDVRSQFPETTQRYTAKMERQYAAILDSGNAFRMSVVRVGERAFRFNRISGVHVRKYEGDLDRVIPLSVSGFLSPGDRAEYEIRVEQTGVYRVEVSGENLDCGRGWRIQRGDQLVSPVRSDPETLVFESLELPVTGPDRFSIRVDEPGDRTRKPVVDAITFHLTGK